MKTLNLVMIVKNEARCLERCLSKVYKLVDEIIIVDTGSTDETKKIAYSYGAHVYDFEWVNDFSAARNFALDQSTSDWNLILDADEFLEYGSREELSEFMENQNQIGDVSLNSAYPDHGEISHSLVRIPRVLPKGVRYSGKIHEQPDCKFPVVILPLTFGHDGYLIEGVKDERDLPYLLEALKIEPHNSYYLYKAACSLHLLKRDREALANFAKFYKYVPVSAGFRAEGIVLYLYTLIDLERYEETLAIIKEEEIGLAGSPSFLFACGIFYMKLVLYNTQKYISYLPKIEQCYIQCLDLGEEAESEGVIGVGSFKAAYNLGTWYEVTGNSLKAKNCYQKSADWGYDKAKERLLHL